MRGRAVADRLGSVARRAWRRVDLWPSLQRAAAATIGCALALQIGDDRQPFFAPMAAVIALNAERGERGINALRLLSGVFVGIAVAEITLLALGGGYGRIGAATLVAVVISRALGGTRIVMGQAAVSAILTVATAGGQGGPDRLIDAAVGTGVALTFTQLLFSPEPVALLRRAEVRALSSLGEGLQHLAVALQGEHDEPIQRALDDLRGLRDQLVDLARMRRASGRVVRHSLVWRSRSGPVVQAKENAGHLDLLIGSSVLLARTAAVLDSTQRSEFVSAVSALAAAVVELVPDPGDRERRQRAADQALDVVRSLPTERPDTREMAAIDVALRLAATDLMVFAGVDPDHASAVVREGTGELPVAAPPRTWRHPFRRRRRART